MMSVPVYIYRFTLGSEVFRYTSRSTQVVVDLGDGNETFTPQSIFSSDIRGEFIDGRGQISMPDTLRPASDFVLGAPATRLFFEAFEIDGTPVFAGFVETCRFNMETRSATFEAVSWNYSRSLVPPQEISIGCNYDLGSTECGVDLDALKVTGTSVVVSSNGLQLTSAAWEVGDGFFTGGFVQLGDEYALIVGHTEGTITLFRALRDTTGTYIAAPGCDKSAATCAAKFSNATRFGGFAFIPGFNPSTRDWEA